MKKNNIHKQWLDDSKKRDVMLFMVWYLRSRHTLKLLWWYAETDGIRRYVHLATGNYNGKQLACILIVVYLLVMMVWVMMRHVSLTLISGYSDPPIWNKFIVAPLNLREKLWNLLTVKSEFC